MRGDGGEVGIGCFRQHSDRFIDCLSVGCVVGFGFPPFLGLARGVWREWPGGRVRRP